MPRDTSQNDASIIQDAYAERLKGLVDTFFLGVVQAPDKSEQAKEAFVRGVLLARAVRDAAIKALPDEGIPPPKPFDTLA